MANSEVIKAIDQALAALKLARKASVASSSVVKTTAKAPTPAQSKGATPKRGGMSEEGRQRVAEAQRKRWAASKKAAKKAARLAK